MFLELLGFITFFGILLIQTQSYRCDLTFCILTVLSISFLCYVVSDLDSPFSGFFRVDVTVINDVITRIEAMYINCSEERESFVGYPNTKRKT